MEAKYTKHTKCRLDGSNLIEVADWGHMYLSDFVDEVGQGQTAPIKLGVGSTSGLLQLYHTVEPNEMYRVYWYDSSLNENMRAALRDVALSASRYVSLRPGDVVLDSACNSGELLKNYPEAVTKVGIDPCDLIERAKPYANVLVKDFFSQRVYEEAVSKKAKIITVIAMFYDLDDPLQFLKETKACLADDGILIMQMSYTPLLVKMRDFMEVSHEHVCYYDLQILRKLARAADLEIVNAELNNTNGRSLRIYLAHSANHLNCPTHEIHLGKWNVDSLNNQETLVRYAQKIQDPIRSRGTLSVAAYKDFFSSLKEIKAQTVGFLQELKAAGKTVFGYGASSKGNTLLQYYGLGPEIITAIAERSEAKWGKLTAGSWIPICSEEEIRKAKPDYLFVLPWVFMNVFVERERELLNSGTKFIVPLPELAIIDNEGWKKV